MQHIQLAREAFDIAGPAIYRIGKKYYGEEIAEQILTDVLEIIMQTPIPQVFSDHKMKVNYLVVKATITASHFLKLHEDKLN